MSSGGSDVVRRKSMSTSQCCRSFVVTFLHVLLYSSLLHVLLEAKTIKSSARSDDSLLSGAVSEIEDALSRLKQYAKNIKLYSDDDPLAESIERPSRDEDYRQEPEVAPGLNRLEKNLDEAREAAKNSGRSGDSKSSEKDDASDISLQDLVVFLRENVKNKKKEDAGKNIESGETKDKSAAKDDSNDLSLKEALEYLANLKKKNLSEERTQ